MSTLAEEFVKRFTAGQRISGWTREDVRPRGDKIEVLYVEDGTFGENVQFGSYEYDRGVIEKLFEVARDDENREPYEQIMGALRDMRRAFAEACERRTKAA